MGFEEILRNVAYTIARFMAFSAHAFLFGAPVVILLVLRPAFRDAAHERWDEGRARVARRLEGLTASALISSAVATAVAIALQATLVAELDEGDLATPSFLSVFSTTFGQWHLFRYPLLAGLFVLLSSKVEQWSLRPGGGASRVWWGGWLGLSLALLATSSFTGHAAVSSPRALGLVNDIVHLGAASVWFAGIVILAVLLPDAWRGRDDLTSLELLGPSVVRFSKVALISITTVAVTGTINSLLNVAKFADLWRSPYGLSLSTKIALFLGVLALGGVNHLVLRERLRRGTNAGRARSAQRTFRVTIATELVIAVLIMAMTGWLVGQSKTRQTMLPPGPPVTTGRD
ncbi:MAG TPA: CopD family protein [Actinomycetota bacterium]|nr:CopD family protein [Actinomycetota bacterium]